MGRAPCCDKANVKKGPWSPEEDGKLKDYMEKHGTGGNWIALPQKIGLKRCGKSCRLRWLNYLRPNIKHGGFTEEEDRIICSLYVSIGSRWSIIAAQLPGRTDNDIKNYWNTKLKKKLFGKQRKEHKARGSSLNQGAERGYGNPMLQENTYWPELPVLAPIPFSNQDQSYNHQACFINLVNKPGTTGRLFSDEKPIQEEAYLQYPFVDHISSTQQLCEQSLTNISSSPLINNMKGAEYMHSDYYMNGEDLTDLLGQSSYPGEVDDLLYSNPQRLETPGHLYEADSSKSGISSVETTGWGEMSSIVNPVASNEQEMLQACDFSDYISSI